MKKSIVIAALVLWNLVLMSVLAYMLANWHPRSNVTANAKPPGIPRADSGSDVQEFTFKPGEHLNSDVAPPVADRGLAITATIDTQQNDGVREPTNNGCELKMSVEKLEAGCRNVRPWQETRFR